MCVIGYKPAGVKLTREILSESWENNPDGGGIMYRHASGELGISKTMDKEEFITNALKIKGPMVYHCRIRSKGNISADNLHPFIVSGSLGLMHNGTISNLGDAEKSDTKHLAEVATKLKIVDLETLAELLKLIGGYNKYAIMDKTGEVTTVGNGWVEALGCKFSNETYKKSDFVYRGSTKVYKNNYNYNAYYDSPEYKQKLDQWYGRREINYGY
jgi:predicted glutamine amidotransferase